MMNDIRSKEKRSFQRNLFTILLCFVMLVNPIMYMIAIDEDDTECHQDSCTEPDLVMDTDLVAEPYLLIETDDELQDDEEIDSYLHETPDTLVRPIIRNTTTVSGSVDEEEPEVPEESEPEPEPEPETPPDEVDEPERLTPKSNSARGDETEPETPATPEAESIKTIRSMISDVIEELKEVVSRGEKCLQLLKNAQNTVEEIYISEDECET